MKNSTIYSLSSGAGLAGVAVVRISGPEARVCIDKMCNKPLLPRQASLRKICHPLDGSQLDEGLVIWLPGPNSFTGEDIVEFQVHGGQATLRAVLNGLENIAGFEQAEAGEFSKRAFMNGRLDLVEIEGLGDLIHAQTEAQRKQALRQSAGRSSEQFEKWRSDLIGMLGYLEASIDFVEEEDIANNALSGLLDKMIHLRNDMQKHLVDSVRGQAVRSGVKIVLIGKPNVGKSSILNYLANRDVAIVSDIPGTTRDVIEVQLDLEGIPVVLSDTAGLNAKANDAIELEGISRTETKASQADIIIRVVTGDDPIGDFLIGTSQEHLLVCNKSDLARHQNQAVINVSANTGDGMDKLLRKITESVALKFGGQEPAIITRERQKDALENSVFHLQKAIDENLNSPELVGEQLRLAGTQLGRLVGRIDVEDLLDVVFRDFCVGK